MVLYNCSLAKIHTLPSTRIQLNLTKIPIKAGTPICFYCRGGVKSNQTNFELIFIKFFESFFTFRINGIINFQIELNKFRTNPASKKFEIHPIVGVESNRTNFKLIFIKFFEYFWPFQIDRIANFRNEWISNEFWTNSNLIPSLAQTQFGFTNKWSRMHQ